MKTHTKYTEINTNVSTHSGIIGVARIFSGGVHFFLEKIDDLFCCRPQNTG